VFGYYGLLMEVKDRNNNKITFAYATPLSANSQATSVTDTRGRTLTFTYGSNGFLSSINESWRSWSFGYTNGYLTSYTDPNSRVTDYSYDANGRLSQINDPRG
jgi:YD repeat-containing protein